MNRPSRFLPSLAFLGLVACGGAEEVGSPRIEPEELPSQAQSVEPAPSYEVHEWGLIDLGPSDFEIAAGPGSTLAGTTPTVVPTPVTPMNMTQTPVTPMNTPSVMHHPAATRKPVLYVHLANQAPITFSVGVTVAGAIAEHWPPADVVGSTLRWSSVTAAPGQCTGATYPTRQSDACRAAPDGYCELADLHGYETNDGACLTYKGQLWEHLFYRGRGAEVERPVSATRVGTTVDVTNVSLGEGGALYYVHRNAVGSREPVLAARLQTPAVGQPARFPELSAGATASVRQELAASLRTGGLSEDEASAFERAWFSELFENGRTGGAPLVQDALIYVLPQSALDSISRLEFEPAPTAVKRVFWVRMVL